MAKRNKVHIMDHETLKSKTGNAFLWGIAVVLVIIAIAVSL